MDPNLITASHKVAQIVKPYDPTTVMPNIEESAGTTSMIPLVGTIGLVIIVATIVLFFVIRKQMRG